MHSSPSRMVLRCDAATTSVNGKPLTKGIFSHSIYFKNSIFVFCTATF